MLTTVIGLDDVIVVSTGDAVLVAARDKAEQVKAAGRAAQGQNRREAVEHRRIYRPWGYYQGIDVGARYQVKRIVVKPGGKLSLQKHFHRAEHWVVVKGTAEVTVGSEVSTVHENESVYIPIGSVHRLANPGKDPTRTDRGSSRQLPRRGRYRASRRRIWTMMQRRSVKKCATNALTSVAAPIGMIRCLCEFDLPCETLYLQDTYRIPTGYLQDTCSIPAAYLQHTCSIPAAYLQHTCSIPAAYLQHTYSIPTAYLQRSTIRRTAPPELFWRGADIRRWIKQSMLPLWHRFEQIYSSMHAPLRCCRGDYEAL